MRDNRHRGRIVLVLALVALTVAGIMLAVQRESHRPAVSIPRQDLVDPAPSGQRMPKGDLPGWQLRFNDDFTKTAGGLVPEYGPRWTAYRGYSDTSHHGTYSLDTLSVHNAMLDIHLRSLDGRPQTAAPMPSLRGDGKHLGQRYGLYIVRFKADQIAGYKTAWLLWPDSNDSSEGEIDFPEGDLDGPIKAFDHDVGDHRRNALATTTDATFAQWHTAAIEWLPSGVAFFLDGKLVGHSTMSPHVSMHWILQTETALHEPAPAPAVSGHVYVDWVAVYAPAPSKNPTSMPVAR